MSLRIRRGTDSQRTQHVFDLGEIVYTTDTGKVFIGDGQTAGGNHILKTSAGVGFTFNDLTQEIDFSVPSLNLTTADVSEDSSRKYFTNARALDAVGAALQAGPNNGIAFTYNTQTGVISAQVTEGINGLLPDQSGQQGKWLTTDGSNVSWATAPLGGLSFPSPTGHQSQFLTTADGATLSWGTPTVSSLTNGVWAVSLASNGKTSFQNDVLISGGSVLLSSSGDIKRDVGGGVYASVLGGLSSIVQDTSPTLGGNLGLNGHNITGTGNINISGSITASTALSGNTVAATLGVSGNSVTATTSVTGATLNTVNLTLSGATITSTNVGSNITTERTDYVVNLGTDASPVTLWGQSSQNFAYLTGLTDGSNNSGITSRISRGSLASKTALQSGDIMLYLEGQGYDGTNFVNAGGILLGVDPDQSVATGIMPSIAGFLTISPAGDPNYMTFNSTGVFTAPIIKAASYATGSLPTATGAAEEGYIVFDSTTKQFKGWNGTSWVVLG